MRFPRFRTRTLILAVAAVAACLEGWFIRQQSIEYSKRAAQYARYVSYAQEIALRHKTRWQELSNELQRCSVPPSDEDADDDTRFGRDRLTWTVSEEVNRDAIKLLEGEVQCAKERFEQSARDLEYQLELCWKYEYAARRPWLPIAPDRVPPSPIDRVYYWFARREYRLVADAYEELFDRDFRDSAGRFRQIGCLRKCAWLLATCADPRQRDGPRAVKVATRFGQLVDWDCLALDTLAAAQAEVGDFPLAIRSQTRALQRLPANSPERHTMNARLLQYRRGKPWREEPPARW